MPRVKIYWFDDAVANLSNVLKAWQRHRDRDAEQMSKALRCSPGTWFARMRKPENLTLEEVWRAINYLKIPPDEAVAMLTAGIEALKK